MRKFIYMKKSLILYSTLVVLYGMLACNKQNNVKPSMKSSASKNELNTQSVNWNAMTPDDVVATCENFVSYLEGSSSGEIILSDAIEHLEGALNYKYARVNNPFENRYFFSQSYSYAEDGTGNLSNVEIRRIYNQIKADIKAFGLATGNDAGNLLLNLVDVEAKEASSKFEVKAILGSYPSFDPNHDFEFTAISCPTGENYRNNADMMCAGSTPAPCTIPTGASASWVGTMYYYDKNYLMSYPSNIGTVFTPSSTLAYVSPFDMSNGFNGVTNPYVPQHTILWHDLSQAPDDCMVASKINYYWNTIIPTALPFTKSSNNVPNSWLYAGNYPCTWAGYADPGDPSQVAIGDVWMLGGFFFSIFTQGAAMPAPNLIFQ